MARKGGGKRKASGNVAGATPAKQRGGRAKVGVRSGHGRRTVVTGDVEHAIDDVYEADDVAVDEEVHQDRYDDLDDEYELPADFEDEEIDEDEAFNSEDERQFGHLFEEKNGGRYSDFDSEEDSEEEEGDRGGKGAAGMAAYDALLSDEDEESAGDEERDEANQSDEEYDEDDELAWPTEEDRGGIGQTGNDGPAGLGDDGSEGGGIHAQDGYDSQFDDQMDDEEEADDGGRGTGRTEMIRELYPENIYAVGPGASCC